MKLIYALMTTLITASMFACGGGGSGSIVLGPQEIPTEYADLSMGDLENRSSDITHKELTTGNFARRPKAKTIPVSYTHLTLPTNREV